MQRFVFMQTETIQLVFVFETFLVVEKLASILEWPLNMENSEIEKLLWEAIEYI